MKRINLKKSPKITIEILVTFIDGSDSFIDAMDGMSFRDAMYKARKNWDDAKITFLDDITSKTA